MSIYEKSRLAEECPECGEITSPYIVRSYEEGCDILLCENCLSRIHGDGTSLEIFLIDRYNDMHARALKAEEELKKVYIPGSQT